MTKLRLIALCFAVLAATVQADQACSVPPALNLPATRLVPVDCQNTRAATDYYVLSLSWSPKYCQDNGDRRDARFQCESNRFGLVVHGLWPQSRNGRGKCDQPRHCRASLVDRATARDFLCTMPSVPLMQGEWQKHGSCAFDTPRDYLGRTAQLHADLTLPDLRELARKRGGQVPAGEIVDAIVVANAKAGLKRESVVVRVESGNRFSEVLLCYDKAFRFMGCKLGGTPPGKSVRVVY